MLISIWNSPYGSDVLEKPGQHKGFPEMHLDEPERTGFFGLFRGNKDRLDPEFYRKRKERATVAAQTLWTNRSVFTQDMAEYEKHRFEREWIPLASGQEHLKDFINRRHSVFLGWGHNTFDVSPDSRLGSDGWDAVVLTQYFYAAFDSINTSLNGFIGVSLSDLKPDQIRRLSQTLLELNTYSNMLLISYQDNVLNLQGARRGFVVTLAERYKIDFLISSINEKRAVLSTLIDRLNQKATSIYQRVIEVMLFVIGGLAFVDVTISISQYARSTDVAEPSLSPANDGTWGLLDLGLVLPPDTLIYGSIGFLLIATALYLSLQRGRRA
jgi:hypothetical protein